MKKLTTTVTAAQIERAIFLIREQRVMLDKDLAILYGVSTSQLNKAVSRNPERFPGDFMFQLTKEEHKNLMFQIGTSSWGGIRKRARVFSEQGVAMLSGVLRSKRAVQMNIRIMRAFVKFREFLSTHKEFAQKLIDLENKLGRHDESIRNIIAALRQMMSQPEPKPKGPIGFQS